MDDFCQKTLPPRVKILAYFSLTKELKQEHESKQTVSMEQAFGFGGIAAAGALVLVLLFAVYACKSKLSCCMRNGFKVKGYGHSGNTTQNIGKIDFLYLQTNRY